MLLIILLPGDFSIWMLLLCQMCIWFTTFSFPCIVYVVLKFTWKVYTVWRVISCLLLTLLSDSLWSLWTTEYLNALLTRHHEVEAKQIECPDVVFVADISEQLMNPSTSKSFYFWKPLCKFSDACGLYTFEFSMCVLKLVCLLHCQHVCHHENGMTYDAFSVFDLRAANKSVLSLLFLFYVINQSVYEPLIRNPAQWTIQITAGGWRLVLVKLVHLLLSYFMKYNSYFCFWQRSVQFKIVAKFFKQVSL